MENETYEINKEENEFKYVKNLCIDMDNGKITINDNKNNKFKSDIYGRKIPKFLPNITGYRNRYNSKYIQTESNSLFRKNKISNLKNNSYSLAHNSIENNTFNNNKRNINYTPTIRKFEGYSKFPRPKGPPLLNIPQYEIKEKEKRKIIDNLSNYFGEDYIAKNDVIRKNENKGLSYLTKTLNEYDIIKSDSEKLQKLIQNNLDDIKLKYKMKQNLYKKDNIVKALNEFNYNISENKNSKTINGRILEEPSDKIKKFYKVINTMIKKHKILFQDKGKIINKSLKKKYKTINLKLTSDDANKDFTIGRNIKMNFGGSIEEEKNKNKIIDNTEFMNQENEEIKNNEENIEIKEVINDENEVKDENKENKVENIEYEEENQNDYISSEVNNLDEKIKKNELSFISYTSENEKKYSKINNIQLKSINRIYNKTEHENKLLGGFKEPPIEDTKIFQKQKTARLKTEGDLYLDNLNLLKITNKKAFMIQEQKDLYDLQLLKKKLRNQTINMNNAMGIKQDFKFKNEVINTE